MCVYSSYHCICGFISYFLSTQESNHFWNILLKQFLSILWATKWWFIVLKICICLTTGDVKHFLSACYHFRFFRELCVHSSYFLRDCLLINKGYLPFSSPRCYRYFSFLHFQVNTVMDFCLFTSSLSFWERWIQKSPFLRESVGDGCRWFSQITLKWFRRPKYDPLSHRL